MEEIQHAITGNRYLAYSGTVKTGGVIDTSHRRLLTNRCLMFYTPVPESAYEKETFLYDVSTFCGLVLKVSLIRKIGLPKARYFIWFDDTEYCLRFRKYTRILNVCHAELDHRTAAGERPRRFLEKFLWVPQRHRHRTHLLLLAGRLPGLHPAQPPGPHRH